VRNVVTVVGLIVLALLYAATLAAMIWRHRRAKRRVAMPIPLAMARVHHRRKR